MTLFFRLSNVAILLCSVLALVAPLQAQATLAKTPALKIQIQGPLPKYMTIYFARGRAPLISVEAKQVILSEIKAKIRVTLSGSQLEIPAQSITRSGIFSAYNYLVVILHDQEEFVWLNGDDSVPLNEAQSGTLQARKILVFGTLDIAQFPIDEQGFKRIQIDGF